MTLSGHDGGPVTDILPPNSAIDLGDLSTAPGQQFQSVNGYEEDINDIIDSQKAVVNIVDRYGRVDEWIPSFHNIYTVTYLECMKVLSQRMIIQRKYTNFLQCARAHNSDYVRLKAFDCLVDMDGLKNDSILRYMLYTFQTDTSPYVRDGLFSIFFKGIGRLALGLSMADHQSTRIANPDSGLVIERLDTRETNSLTSLRNNSLEALLATLDKEITDNQLLKTALGEVLR